jgi:hypothetical protein
MGDGFVARDRDSALDSLYLLYRQQCDPPYLIKGVPGVVCQAL